jgi:hypothetical protein
MKYTCLKCGQLHERWPALAFHAPHAYNYLTEKEKRRIAELESDFCIIRYPEQTDRFIRGIMVQKVTDYCENLEYGLWVSLTEQSFDEYRKNYNNENFERTYFGWLSNSLPEYDFKESVPTTIYVRKGKERPEIVPHQTFRHAFVYDYFNGITKAEAEERIMMMKDALKYSSGNKNTRKPWWRLW